MEIAARARVARILTSHGGLIMTGGVSSFDRLQPARVKSVALSHNGDTYDASCSLDEFRVLLIVSARLSVDVLSANILWS